MTNLGVLASHRGTNFQAILDACQQGTLPARVVLAISNNSGSEALARAKKHKIQIEHISSQTHPDDAARDRAICQALEAANVHWVVTAGYMKKLGPVTLERFAGRIVNVHPSLLPRYGGHGMYGQRVHEAVLRNGDAESGLTVHLVDGDYDTGPILAQQRVPVMAEDSAADLAARILAEEHQLLVKTLQSLLAQA